MNVLLADSGSSKTDWALLKDSNVIFNHQTPGFNPYFQSSDQIKVEIEKNLLPQLLSVKIKPDKVYYYGSGCSTPQKCDIVRFAIQSSTGINDVVVEHDLLAAARALCGRKSGIAAILGTGSNSCLYDGIEIIENVPSVGYLWSDYGGGSQIGKFIIRDYFEDELPVDLKLTFEQEGYNREVILDHVYKSSMPSRYLASVSLFAYKHIQHPHILKILHECFDSFFKRQISKYTNSKSFILHTVGSVGFYYRDIILENAKKHGYNIGKVLKSPMEGLIAYHTEES